MLNRTGSIGSPPALPTTSPGHLQMPQPISDQLEAILNRHSLALLDNFGMRDLGNLFKQFNNQS